MDLQACPLQRNEGQPLPWRCHLQRNAIVNTQLWKKRAEKTFIPIWNSGDGEGWKGKGWGIRRADAELVLWFLSFRAELHSFLRSLPQPSSVWGINITSCSTAYILVLSRILEENFTFDPTSMWGFTVVYWFHICQISKRMQCIARKLLFSISVCYHLKGFVKRLTPFSWVCIENQTEANVLFYLKQCDSLLHQMYWLLLLPELHLSCNVLQYLAVLFLCHFTGEKAHKWHLSQLLD